MKDETLLPCPFCGGKAEFDYDDDGLNWISCSTCGVSTDTAYHTDVDARETLRDVWNTRAALQSGNSAQPVTVPDELIHHDKDPEVTKAYKIGFNACLAVVKSATVTVPAGYVLVPVDPTITMTEALWDEIHESRDMNNAYRAMLAAAPKAPDSQLTPAPEDRLQKAIVDACMVFLHGCDSLSKNYECDFSDSETETWFCIANVAKKIGVVEETGNRRWSLSQQMRGEIEEVYRKYAMRIMEAAPKVKP